MSLCFRDQFSGGEVVVSAPSDSFQFLIVAGCRGRTTDSQRPRLNQDPSSPIPSCSNPCSHKSPFAFISLRWALRTRAGDCSWLALARKLGIAGVFGDASQPRVSIASVLHRADEIVAANGGLGLGEALTGGAVQAGEVPVFVVLALNQPPAAVMWLLVAHICRSEGISAFFRQVWSISLPTFLLNRFWLCRLMTVDCCQSSWCQTWGCWKLSELGCLGLLDLLFVHQQVALLAVFMLYMRRDQVWGIHMRGLAGHLDGLPKAFFKMSVEHFPLLGEETLTCQYK